MYIIIDEQRIQIHDNDKLHLLYILEDHGWATFVVAQSGNYAGSHVSYIYDSLHELLKTACLLMMGSQQETVQFHCESGVYRLFLESKLESTISLSMREYEDDRATLGQFREAFKGQCKLDRYVQQLLICCDKILQEEGVEGYLKKWQLDEFPMDKYLELKNLWKE